MALPYAPDSIAESPALKYLDDATGTQKNSPANISATTVTVAKIISETLISPNNSPNPRLPDITVHPPVSFLPFET
jgi:hypothetical protein